MRFLTNLLLILSVFFAPLQPLSPIFLDITKTRVESEKQQEQPTEVAPVETDGETEEITYTAKNFLDLDLEGYGTIRMPQSHFSLNTTTSNNVEKNMLYKDNKSKIKISYITNISEGTDIPGYITREVAGVDTVTNDKEEVVIGDRTWMKVHSENKEENNDVYVWYSLSKGNDTAVWLRVSVHEDSNDAEFDSILQQMLATFQIYYVNGTVFETPETGYYLGKDFNNGTEGDSTEYGANDKANSVFQSRGGYVPDANISPDWQDMQIILDGVRFQLPCQIKTFEDAGYTISSYKYDESYLVGIGATVEIDMINENGTVVTVEVLNNSKTEQSMVSACPVVSLTIDKEKFLSKEEVAENNMTIEEEREAKKSKEQAIYDGTYTEEESSETEVKREMLSPCVVVQNYSSYVVTEMTEDFDPRDNADMIVYTAYKGDNLELVEKIDDGAWYKVKVNEEVQGYINGSSLLVYEDDLRTTAASTDASTEVSTEEDVNAVASTENSTDASTEETSVEDTETSEEESGVKKGNLDTEAVVVNTFEHEMILAGGVTWDVYYDDLVAYYGQVGFTKTKSGSQSYKCTWIEQNRSMIIDIGMLKGIERVKLSVYQK